MKLQLMLLSFISTYFCFFPSNSFIYFFFYFFYFYFLLYFFFFFFLSIFSSLLSFPYHLIFLLLYSFLLFVALPSLSNHSFPHPFPPLPRPFMIQLFFFSNLCSSSSSFPHYVILLFSSLPSSSLSLPQCSSCGREGGSRGLPS